MSDGTSTTVATTPVDAPAPAAAPAAPAAPANSTPSPTAWLGDGANELMVGFAGLKGWKSGADAVQSYQNLEKLLGAEKAGRTVVVPGDNATPEELAAFRSRLGVPNDAKSYDIKLPEGVDTTFADTAKTWFHDAGLTPKQAENMAQKWTEYMTEGQATVAKAKADKVVAEASALDAEWGAAREQNVGLAQRTRQALGIGDAEIDAIADVIGLKRTVQMFHKLGTRTGEAEFIDGTSAANTVMTPAMAKAKIAALQTDKGWVTRYTQGGLAEKNELARLSGLASPEPRK